VRYKLAQQWLKNEALPIEDISDRLGFADRRSFTQAFSRWAGITPSHRHDVDQRLPGKQAELKQKAEALMRELNVRNLPTGDLEEAVNKMELIQKYRSTGQGLQTKQIASELVSSLKDARTAMRASVSSGAEKSNAQAKRISTIRHPDNESTPDGYESSVDAYFRALAEPEPGE